MGKVYNFAVKVTTTGYIQRELDDDEDPETIAQEIEDSMMTEADFTPGLPVEGVETEVTDFGENEGGVYI